MAGAKTVLVTGSSGFIAKPIVRDLLQAGHRVVGSLRTPARAEEVRAAVRPALAAVEDFEDRLRFVALDLGRDAGWDEAMAGIDVLMHTASPFPMSQPKDEAALIRPAVDGTLRALRAAARAGIGRVVLTSSTAAVMYGSHEPGPAGYDEGDWSDVDDHYITAYSKSKTLAERAAWRFVADEAPEMALTTINPCLVLGRPLDGHYGTSLQVIERLLRAREPMLPDFGVPVVDVDDVAAMHVAAMETDAAAGKRIIAAAGTLWFLEIARRLGAAYPERRITNRRAPDVVVRLVGLFDKSVRSILPTLGRREVFDTARARDLLGTSFVAAEDSVLAAARFIVESGKV